MKSKFLAATVAALFIGAVSPVLADNVHIGNTTNNEGGQGGAGGAGGNAAQQQGQIQGQQQGQLQGQQQGNVNTVVVAPVQGQSNDNVNVNKNKANAESESNSLAVSKAANANAQSVTINNPGEIHYSGAYTVKSAPGIALGGPASGPCNGFSGGVAGSGIGFGFAANASTLDEGCEDRETARMLHLLGDTAAGLELLKTSKAYTRMQDRKAELKKKAEEEAATKKAQSDEAARRAAIRQKNPSSDGSWTSGSAEQLPVRVWTGNSEGQSMAFTVQQR